MNNLRLQKNQMRNDAATWRVIRRLIHAQCVPCTSQWSNWNMRSSMKDDTEMSGGRLKKATRS